MQEILLEDVPPMQNTNVGVIIGRMQPPTIGHYKLINELSDAIRKHNHKFPDQHLESYPVVVLVTGKKTGEDTSKNPLSFEDRVKIIRASGRVDSKTMFIEASNAFEALSKVREAGYEPTLVMVGSDRGGKDMPYKRMLDGYFNKDDGSKLKHHFIEVSRNDAKEMGEQAMLHLIDEIEESGIAKDDEVSGTLARKAAELNKLTAFSAMTGLLRKPQIAKIVLKKVMKGAKNG